MEPLKTASRYGKASLIAAIITFAIFFFMQMLVAEKNVAALDYNQGRTVDWVPAEPREPPEVFKPTERPDEVKPPPTPERKTPKPNSPTGGISPEFDPIGTDMGSGLGLPNSGVVGEALMTPIYPIRARQDNVEGYVVLEFTVNTRGRVENIILLDESPKGYGFAKSAIRAAKNFKYRARVINGKAVATTGIRERFEYSLEDDG